MGGNKLLQRQFRNEIAHLRVISHMGVTWVSTPPYTRRIPAGDYEFTPSNVRSELEHRFFTVLSN